MMGLPSLDKTQAAALCSGLEFELQQLNIPLIVEETEYSIEATTDRNKLILIVEGLAKKTVIALKKDSAINKRYATQAFLINQLKKVKHGSRGKEKKLIDEKIKLVLPYTATSWNDLDENDIEIQIYRAVVSINDLYKWRNVRISFEHFINQRTKLLIDKMDEEDESSAVNYNPPVINTVECNSANNTANVYENSMSSLSNARVKKVVNNNQVKVPNPANIGTTSDTQRNKKTNKEASKTPRKKVPKLTNNVTREANKKKEDDIDDDECMIIAEISKQK